MSTAHALLVLFAIWATVISLLSVVLFLTLGCSSDACGSWLIRSTVLLSIIGVLGVFVVPLGFGAMLYLIARDRAE